MAQETVQRVCKAEAGADQAEKEAKIQAAAIVEEAKNQAREIVLSAEEKGRDLRQAKRKEAEQSALDKSNEILKRNEMELQRLEEQSIPKQQRAVKLMIETLFE